MDTTVVDRMAVWMADHELGDIPDWYRSIQEFRYIAEEVYGCRFFELLERLERGEQWWLTWGRVVARAKTQNYSWNRKNER